MNTGWLCPRCETVNAPDTRKCDCVGTTQRIGNKSITQWSNLHGTYKTMEIDGIRSTQNISGLAMQVYLDGKTIGGGVRV